MTLLMEQVEKLSDSTLNAKLYTEGERIRLYIKAWKVIYENYINIRKAKSLKDYIEGTTPLIFDGERIVDSYNRFQFAVLS